MSKIIMLYPPVGYFTDYNTPTGTLYVSTVLKENGYDVRFIDCSIEKDFYEKVMQESKDALCLGSYCMSIHIKHLVPLLHNVKKANPNIKTILGGPHPTLFPEQTAQDELIDFVVRGEGEETMLELVRAIENGAADYSNIKGITYKNGAQVISTPQREFLDMDKLPFVDWSLMSQTALDSMKNKIARVQATRGCPFKCAFCVPEGTLVLTEDVTYVPIETIKKGDIVVGVNEDNSNTYERSTVLETFERVGEVYKIETEGGVVQSTEEHPWLTKTAHRNTSSWRKTDELYIGLNLKKVSEPKKLLEETEDYKIGYIAGAFEGDGHIGEVKHHRSYGLKIYFSLVARLVGDEEMMHTVLRFSDDLGAGVHKQSYYSKQTALNWSVITQKRHLVENIKKYINKDRTEPESEEYKRGYLAGIYDAEGGWTGTLRIHNKNERIINRVKEYLEYFGFQTETDFRRNELVAIRLISGNGEAIRFFALTNPKVKHKMNHIYSISTKSRIANTKITKITPNYRTCKVYNLETTTQNYIADGFVTHNCINVVSKNQKMRYKSPSKVVDEIEHMVKNYGVKRIGFRDEVFLTNRQHARAIAEEIIKRNIKITWLGNPHIKFTREAWIDDEFLSVLTKSGCNKLQCGGESGSQRILDMLHKTQTPEDILNFVKRAKKHNIVPLVAFMSGIPSETKEEQMQTLKLIWQILEANPQTFINGPAMFRPYPGGELYNKCVSEYGLNMPSTFKEWMDAETVGGSKPPWVEELYFTQNLWTHVMFARLENLGQLPETCKKISKKYGLHYAIVAYLYGKMSYLRLKYNYYNFPIEFYILHMLWKWRKEIPELS